MHALWGLYVILAYIGVLRALYVLGRWNARRQEPGVDDAQVSMLAGEFATIWGLLVPALVATAVMFLAFLVMAGCKGHTGGWC